MSERKVALVTGGNRGLGLASCESLIAKGYEVVLTARSESEGLEAAKKIGARFRPLDVSHPKSVLDVAAYVKSEFGRLDVLINNAGIFPERGSAFETTVENLHAALTTNTVGPYLMCQQLIPIMKKNGYGRVVNVSSGLGQLTEMDGGGHGAYRISKTALNAVTKLFSSETHGSNILVNSVCPGWVKTDMGGAAAPRSLEQGAFSIVWAATLPEGGPSGGFFRDGKAISW